MKEGTQQSKALGTGKYSFSSLVAGADSPIQDIPDERIEGIWRQIIDVFRGGILADW